MITLSIFDHVEIKDLILEGIEYNANYSINLRRQKDSSWAFFIYMHDEDDLPKITEEYRVYEFFIRDQTDRFIPFHLNISSVTLTGPLRFRVDKDDSGNDRLYVSLLPSQSD